MHLYYNMYYILDNIILYYVGLVDLFDFVHIRP